MSVCGEIFNAPEKIKPQIKWFYSGFFKQGDKLIKTNTTFAVRLYSTSISL